MQIQKCLHSIFISLVSIWLAWTVMVDLVVAPSIFRVIEDFFNAGDLAMVLFSKLNNLELILSSCLLLTTIAMFRQNRIKFVLILVSLITLLVIFYFSYLTPKIIFLTQLWKKAEIMGVIGIDDVSDIQLEHQYFHKVYITLDSVKLIILATLLGYGIIKKEKLS